MAAGMGTLLVWVFLVSMTVSAGVHLAAEPPDD
jgi:hypothetical protein